MAQCNSIVRSPLVAMSVCSVQYVFFTISGLRAKLRRHGSNVSGWKSNSISIFSYHGRWVCHHIPMENFSLSALRILMKQPNSQYNEGSFAARSTRITFFATSRLLNGTRWPRKSMYRRRCLAVSSCGPWVLLTSASSSCAAAMFVLGLLFFHNLWDPHPRVGVHPFITSQLPSSCFETSKSLFIVSCTQKCKSFSNFGSLFFLPSHQRAFHAATSSLVSEVKFTCIIARVCAEKNLLLKAKGTWSHS